MRLYDGNRTSASKNIYRNDYTTRKARRQGIRPLPALLGFMLMFGAVGLTDCGMLSLRALMFGGVKNA